MSARWHLMLHGGSGTTVVYRSASRGGRLAPPSRHHRTPPTAGPQGRLSSHDMSRARAVAYPCKREACALQVRQLPWARGSSDGAHAGPGFPMLSSTTARTHSPPMKQACMVTAMERRQRAPEEACAAALAAFEACCGRELGGQRPEEAREACLSSRTWRTAAEASATAAPAR